MKKEMHALREKKAVFLEQIHAASNLLLCPDLQFEYDHINVSFTSTESSQPPRVDDKNQKQRATVESHTSFGSFSSFKTDLGRKKKETKSVPFFSLFSRAAGCGVGSCSLSPGAEFTPCAGALEAIPPLQNTRIPPSQPSASRLARLRRFLPSFFCGDHKKRNAETVLILARCSKKDLTPSTEL